MKIKEAEIITVHDLIKRKKQPSQFSFSPEAEIKDLKPKKYPYLYSDYFGNYGLFCNFSKGKGVVLLNQQAQNILALCDGKKTIEDIVKVLSSKEKAKLRFSDVWNLGKKEISFQEAYKKLKEGKKFLDLNDFKKVIFLFNKFGLIYDLEFSSEPKKIKKFQLLNPLEVYFCLDEMDKEKGFEAVDSIFKLARNDDNEVILIKFFIEKPEKTPLLKEIIRFSRQKSLEYFIEVVPFLFTNCDLINPSFIKDSRQLRANLIFSLKEIKRDKIKILEQEKIPAAFAITLSSQNLNKIKKIIHFLLKKKFNFAIDFIPRDSSMINNLIPDKEKLVRTMENVYNMISKELPPRSLFSNILGRTFFLFRDEKIKKRNLLNVYQKGNLLKIEKVNLAAREIKNCNKCSFKELCSNSCPLITGHHSFYSNNLGDYCEVYKELIPKALKLEAQRLLKYKNNG
jgi:radical SAM protein with 4Fe4S-binding SPASM domain